MKEDLKQAIIDKKIELIINSNAEEIYELYCEIYPEKITSDFMLEDIDPIELYEFVKDHFLGDDDECQ